MASFIDRITKAPLVFETRAAQIAWERWHEAAGALGEADRAATRALETHEEMRALLDGVFGCSPFLTRTILRELAWFAHAMQASPEEVLDAITSEMASQVAAAADMAEAMRHLRIARGRAAVLIALADLGGLFDLRAVTGALTLFADAALGASLRRLLSDAAAKGQFNPRRAESPEEACGIFLLAMGKYGAFELNYSSDIDLIALYDRDEMPVAESVEPGPFAVRIVQGITQMLQQRTEDGYALRVDLRLRPDGSASPVAISTVAAEQYYEAAGQNWERAALIKARVCSGDDAVGEDFMKALTPYIWRKHLDFAAIEDIHAIKRQIHVHKGHGDITIAGHNVKLGRGGIREIEFFAQTQQLILGGREPELRVRGTCDALDLLALRDHIEPATRDELEAAYDYLRMIEHRLQMIEDEQTHTLPKSAEGLDHVARFCGYSETGDLERDLRAHMTRVQAHYADLFESGETLASEAGSLVFTGVEDDLETLETLTRLGFKRAQGVSKAIRGWHHGRIRATRSARAREGLTRLVPFLIQAAARTPDPDAAFNEFTRFVEAVPTGVQLFALLVSNPQLLGVLFDLFSLAPRLAHVLAAQPATLDSLIGQEKIDLSGAALDTDLSKAIANAQSLEEQLDQARIFARERQFYTAVHVLKEGMSGAEAGAAFTAVAEAVIRGLFEIAQDEMEHRHGRIEGGEWAVIGMGKLGGREMTATSDLDLVFVYGFDPAREMSKGPRPLAAGEFYARAGQSLISLLTVPTREGKLYEVDMRLRPSGRAGPIAVTLERLKSYHESQAWTFEHMALTRARFIAGSAALGERALAIIKDVLTKERDLAKLSADALDMRARLAATKPVKDPWALKLVRGGLVDLEYVAQALELAFAHDHPDILATSTTRVLDNIDVLGLLPAEEIDALKAAARFYTGLSQVMQICYDEERAPEDTQNVRARVAAILAMPSYEALEAQLLKTEARVRDLFDKWVANLNAQSRG